MIIGPKKVVQDTRDVETLLGMQYQNNPIKTFRELRARTYVRTYIHFGILDSTEVENNDG